MDDESNTNYGYVKRRRGHPLTVRNWLYHGDALPFSTIRPKISKIPTRVILNDAVRRTVGGSETGNGPVDKILEYLGDKGVDWLAEGAVANVHVILHELFPVLDEGNVSALSRIFVDEMRPYARKGLDAVVNPKKIAKSIKNYLGVNEKRFNQYMNSIFGISQWVTPISEFIS